MGRTLKRVPLDFDYPLNKVWYGYCISYCRDGECDDCREFAKMKGIALTSYNCPDFEPVLGPPVGDGFQLWETTSEGSPVSPVFKTLDELCEWCEENATTFGSMKATKEQWRQMLDSDFVHAQCGNAIFI